MFVAITAVAILFGLAAWGGWVKSDAVVYLAIAVLAGVFWRAARHALIGTVMILGALWLTAFLAELIFSPSRGGSDNLRFIWIFTPLVLSSAVILRTWLRATAWSLIGSLVLVELFIAAVIIYLWGGSILLQTIATEYRDSTFRSFLSMHFSEQRWYIATPWLLGIAVGEIIVRRRKPSGGEPQAV